jgi:hypothetical protein
MMNRVNTSTEGYDTKRVDSAIRVLILWLETLQIEENDAFQESHSLETDAGTPAARKCDRSTKRETRIRVHSRV